METVQKMNGENGKPAGGKHASDVEAVILAGGHAWGENPLEQTVCRPLVPLAGRPLILHTIDWLTSGGITRISICVNHEGRQIRKLLGDGSLLGVELNYYEDVMPRGPAGCARDVSGGSDAERFLVMEGMLLPQINLADLLANGAGSVLTVVVTPGRAFAGPKERVLEPAGMYMFSRAAFAHVPETGYQDIKETLIPRLHVNGERVDTFVVDPIQLPSVSGLAEYLRVSHQTIEQMTQRDIPEGYRRVDTSLVHVTARVDSSARLVGPVLIEPEAELGPGCIVVGPTTVGRRTRIGAGAVVCRCILWESCTIEKGATLDQCIVTDYSVVSVGRDLRHAVVVPPQRKLSQRQKLQSSDAGRATFGTMPAEGVRGELRQAGAGNSDQNPVVAGRKTAEAAVAQSAPDAHTNEVKV